MKREAVLITGANGEIGHGLIDYLQQKCDFDIIAMDIQPLDESLSAYCHQFIQGNILDVKLLNEIANQYPIRTVYHLASLLSTGAEKNPELAHNVNVNGTFNLLKMADILGEKSGVATKFIYPSSIAAYGLPGIKEKMSAGKVTEDQYISSTITLYGINKLYCENLGRYFMDYYGQIQPEGARKNVDFRAVRFPGLISAITLPTGGTTDYGPEMIHAAAQNKPYACFVRPDTRLPFMVMPDAIKSLILLEAAPKASLTQTVYNVTSFSPTAQELVDIVKGAFPDAQIAYKVDESRQRFVDTWPVDIDDSAARRDWGWAPEYDQDRAFYELLIPAVKQRYGTKIGH
ncbi:MAG: NAD-dependent epimerase/dehydratase family protein [Chloroflexi bacterium]|nr:NAD-dependent epimerase/dehydratase family protein [Chloroflexota bacterium]